MKVRWGAATLLCLLAGGAAAHDMDGMKMGGTDEWSAIGQPGKAGAAARTIAVSASGMHYSLKTIEIRRGETIRFVVTNRAPVKHEFVLGTRAFHAQHLKEMAAMPGMDMNEANSIDLKPGETRTLLWQFTKPGEFLFGCDIPGHFQSGMVGTLHVR